MNHRYLLFDIMTMSRAKVQTVYNVTCPLCGFIKTYDTIDRANAFAAAHDCQKYRNGWSTGEDTP